MSKVRKLVTLDEELVESARTKLGMPLSTFFNLSLQRELQCTDDFEEIEKEIREYESHLSFLKSKINRLENAKQREIDLNDSLMKAFSTLERINSQCGMIGENQIDNIAMFRKVDKFKLKKMCQEAGFDVVQGLEPYKEGKSKTP